MGLNNVEVTDEELNELVEFMAGSKGTPPRETEDKARTSGDPTEEAIADIFGHEGKKGAPPPRETEDTEDEEAEYMAEVDAIRTEWEDLKAEIRAHAKKYAKR